MPLSPPADPTTSLRRSWDLDGSGGRIMGVVPYGPLTVPAESAARQLRPAVAALKGALKRGWKQAVLSP